MSNFYNELEKQWIGRYFKYFRSVNHITIESIVNDSACSRKTYKAIEEGIVKYEDEYYDHLIHFFQLSFIHDANMLHQVEDKMNELYDYCEKLENQKIQSCISEMKKLISNYQHSIIYQEILECLDILEDYYLNEKLISETLIWKLIYVSEVFPYHFSTLLYEVVERSNGKLLNNKINHVMSFLFKEQNNISKFFMANYELEKKNIFKPVEYYEGIAKEFRCQGNVIRLFETLLDLNHIYAEFYPDKSLVIKEEISNLLEKYDIPIRIKKRYYHSIGREYFFNSDYANARIFLKKVLSIECRINTCIFYLSCFSHLNEKEQEYIYFDFDENHRLFHYFEFFKLKFEEKSFQKLEDYLMKEVLKQLKKDQYLEPWWNMFDYELSELTKKTRNYSKYQKFIELRKKTVKIS